MARIKTKKQDPEKPISTSVKSERVNGHMVVTTTETYNAIIDYQDIFDKCEVSEDEDMGPPWKEHDGWEHEVVDLEDEITNPRDVQGAFMDYPGRWKRIVITHATLEEWQGKYGQYGPSGEHRSAYEDRLTYYRRKALETLKKWYEDGYHWYVVDCEFMDHHASLGGIQTEDDDPCDPYLEEVKHDVVNDVIYELEKEGYTVINQPSDETPEDMRAQNRKNFQWKMAHNNGFKDYAHYRRWVEDREVRWVKGIPPHFWPDWKPEFETKDGVTKITNLPDENVVTIDQSESN